MRSKHVSTDSVVWQKRNTFLDVRKNSFYTSVNIVLINSQAVRHQSVVGVEFVKFGLNVGQLNVLYAHI